MPMDLWPLKRPLNWNFVVSSEEVKKRASKKSDPPSFVFFSALSTLRRPMALAKCWPGGNANFENL